jgi:hypothetical protein
MVSSGLCAAPRITPRRPTAGKAWFELCTCDPLLSIMEQLMHSTEIFLSGVYRLRPKLPARDNGVVPWHQDQVRKTPSWPRSWATSSIF